MKILKNNGAINWIAILVGIIVGILYIYSGGLSPVVIIFLVANLVESLAHLARLRLYAGKFEGKLNNASLERKLLLFFLILAMIGIELSIEIGVLENIRIVDRMAIHMFIVLNILKLMTKVRIYDNGLYILWRFYNYSELYVYKVLKNGNIKLKANMRPSESFVIQRGNEPIAAALIERVEGEI
jgi:hypothetical protein